MEMSAFSIGTINAEPNKNGNQWRRRNQSTRCEVAIMSDIKLQGSNLFATFKTEKELKDYIQNNTPKEEQRLLWLGVMFGGNYIAHQVNTTFDLKYKKDKK